VHRNAVLLVAILSVVACTIVASDALWERLEAGVNRVILGVEILEARTDIAGYSGFEERSWWFKEGLKGWAVRPIFGHGVEAFRSNFGITSHATTVDLLYNYGLIGFVLFYAIFASIGWRLAMGRHIRGSPGLRAIIFGSLICYLFMTLSGTMHYNTFFAAFVGMSAVLLSQGRGSRCGEISMGGGL
jgi:O-antigen ligase